MWKGFVAGVLALIALLAVVALVDPKQTAEPQPNIGYSDLMGEVERQQVADMIIRGSILTGHFTDGRFFVSYAPADPTLVPHLLERKVRLSAVPSEEQLPSLFSIVLSWLPSIILIMVWYGTVRDHGRTVSRKLDELKEAIRGLSGAAGGSPPAN
jgi:cell division protease FtsH